MTNQPHLPIDILKKNLSDHNIEERWLPPKLVSEILGVSPKWLSAAREGRKGILGPPFVKLGEGRTAPIRYQALQNPQIIGSQWLWPFKLNPVTSKLINNMKFARAPLPFLQGAKQQR